MRAAASLAAVVAAAGAAEGKPHIVLVVADDLGYNDVGFHGSEIKTPFLDSLVGDGHGVLLQNYYGQSICTPARSSLLTGRYASHTGMQHSYWRQGSDGGLPLGFQTLGDRFKAAGYDTAMVGKWHLGFETWAYTPLERGFDTYYGYLGGGEDYFTHKSGNYVDLSDMRTGVLNESGSYSTELFANKSIDRISSHAARYSDHETGAVTAPFFLYLAMQAVHGPIEAPAEAVKEYSWITNAHRRTMAAMTTILDAQLERVVDALKAASMWQNTVFAFSADNGGPPYVANSNWPMRGGKWTMWEGGTHITGFIHAPTLLPAAPKNFTGLMHQCDWVPTLLGAAGLNATLENATLPPLDGMDMWPALSDPSAIAGPRTSVLLNVDPTNQGPTLFDAKGWSGYAGIRIGDYKLVLGDPGVPNSWCWPNQNTTEGELRALRALGVNGSTSHESKPLEGHYESVNEGCAADPTVSLDLADGVAGGCAVTDYAKCTCGYNGSVPNNREAPLLFNLVNDPRETINLAGDKVHAAKLQELRAALNVYVASALTPLNEKAAERGADPDSNPGKQGREYWAPWH